MSPIAIQNATDDVSFARVAFKASHNSYAFSPPLVRQLEWNSRATYRAGCRGLELDVVQSESAWQWSVQHGGTYVDHPAHQLSTFLRHIATWSTQASNPPAVPITLHIDLKNAPLSDERFPDEFDKYVTSALPPASLFTPHAFLGSKPDLLTAAQTYGWPRMAELRGTFIVCLTGQQHARTSTYISSIAARSCFCDLDIGEALTSPIPARNEPNRLFYNFYPMPQTYAWGANIRRLRDLGTFVVRAYSINDERTWKRALRAGVNILATDQVFLTRWAQVT